jgi:ABC-type sugar transport system substrate-binding protein
MKKYIYIALVVMLVASAVLTGCAPKTSSTTQKAGETKPMKLVKIGYVQMNLTAAYYLEMQKGFQEAQNRLPIQLDVLDSQGNLDKQIAHIENLIARKVDVICLDPVDAVALEPVVKKAVAAGIIVQGAHNIIAGATDAVTFSEYNTGQTLGNYAVQLLSGRYGTPKGQVALILGSVGNWVNIQRETGFKDALAKYPDIKIVAEEFSNWDPVQGVTIMQNYLTTYPDLDLVYGVSDGFMPSAADAVKEAGREDKIFVLSVDGLTASLDQIQSGVGIDATVVNAAIADGFYQIYWAYLAGLGVKVPAHIEVHSPFVNKDNVAAAKAMLTSMAADPKTYPFELSQTDYLKAASK